MAENKGWRQSPRKHRAKYTNKSILRSDKRSLSDSRQAHAERIAVPRGGCYSSGVRRGIGAVIFVLGFPAAIAGIIMTVVHATDNPEGKKYPVSFATAGPILIVVAVVFLCTGIILSSPLVFKALQQCFSFDDAQSFCRVRCPKLSHFLIPDDTIIMNQHAMNALQTEPGKSVLKKLPNCNHGDNESSYHLTNKDVVTGEPIEPTPASNDLDVVSELKFGNKSKGTTKGVRFYESDEDDFRPARALSVTSSDNGSMLSLRNCKVQPKSGVWCTDTHMKKESLENILRTPEQFTTKF